MTDSITVTIHSFISPDEPIDGFQQGESFTMVLTAGMTLGELVRKLFYKNADHIGVIALNGKLASEKTILLPGDSITVYPLLEGG